MKSGFFILFSIYWFQEVNLSANVYATEAVDGIGIEGKMLSLRPRSMKPLLTLNNLRIYTVANNDFRNIYFKSFNQMESQPDME